MKSVTVMRINASPFFKSLLPITRMGAGGGGGGGGGGRKFFICETVTLSFVA